jgi:hypothetical protein
VPDIVVGEQLGARCVRTVSAAAANGAEVTSPDWPLTSQPCKRLPGNACFGLSPKTRLTAGDEPKAQAKAKREILACSNGP